MTNTRNKLVALFGHRRRSTSCNLFFYAVNYILNLTLGIDGAEGDFQL